MKKILFFLFISFFYVSSIDAAITTKPVLNLETAKLMAQTCLDLAVKEKWKINIAIYESPGSLKYYASMDGAYPASELISHIKGKTSAGLPFTTRTLSEMAFNNNNNVSEGIATIPDIALIPGGVPILLNDGTHLGGIGVSGSSGKNDETCAQTAVDKGLQIIHE